MFWLELTLWTFVSNLPKLKKAKPSKQFHQISKYVDDKNHPYLIYQKGFG